MGNIFNYDNKFFRALNKIVDCFFVSVLWFVFCIPIVTIGASTTALYETTHKVLRRGQSYVWRTFWNSFKSNFKKSTLMWLIFLVIFVVLYLDSVISKQFLEQESQFGAMYFFFYFMMLFVYVWAIYVFAYNARFELNKRGILKNGALLAIANLPWSFLMIVIFIVAVLAAFFVPMMFFLAPALMFMIYEVILERIFRKIMSPEELQRELDEDWEQKE